MLRPSSQNCGAGRYVLLVVDDNSIAAEHVRAGLDEVGVQADTCFSGAEALRMTEVQHTKQTPYKLVLMDRHQSRDSFTSSTVVLLRISRYASDASWLFPCLLRTAQSVERTMTMVHH